MSQRRELLIIMALLVVGWMLAMGLLGRWQASRDQRRGAEPELPRYPGTEAVEEQTSPSIGLRKYWFRVEEDYPSDSVYRFYRRELEARGWRLVGGDTRPGWTRQRQGEELLDVFRATWVDAKGLFQVDLEMTSTVRQREGDLGQLIQERDPGMKVYVTMRRVLIPGLGPPPDRSAPHESGVEVE